jgi:hypothetical protein
LALSDSFLISKGGWASILVTGSEDAIVSGIGLGFWRLGSGEEGVDIVLLENWGKEGWIDALGFSRTRLGGAAGDDGGVYG